MRALVCIPFPLLFPLLRYSIISLIYFVLANKRSKRIMAELICIDPQDSDEISMKFETISSRFELNETIDAIEKSFAKFFIIRL